MSALRLSVCAVLGAAGIVLGMVACRLRPARTRRAIPWIAAERGYIDGVIQPHETRLLLRKSLHLLRDKPIKRVQRKHGLLPI